MNLHISVSERNLITWVRPHDRLRPDVGPLKPALQGLASALGARGLTFLGRRPPGQFESMNDIDIPVNEVDVLRMLLHPKPGTYHFMAAGNEQKAGDLFFYFMRDGWLPLEKKLAPDAIPALRKELTRLYRIDRENRPDLRGVVNRGNFEFLFPEEVDKVLHAPELQGDWAALLQQYGDDAQNMKSRLEKFSETFKVESVYLQSTQLLDSAK